jgi:hypothetical protein
MKFRIKTTPQKSADLLARERQALWTALRCSIAHRFDYWLQLCFPSLVGPVAAWLDKQLWHILETATGLTIPRTASGLEGECVLPVPVAGRDGRTFQELVVRAPVRLGGFGLCSHADTAGLAFLGALE